MASKSRVPINGSADFDALGDYVATLKQRKHRLLAERDQLLAERARVSAQLDAVRAQLTWQANKLSHGARVERRSGASGRRKTDPIG